MLVTAKSTLCGRISTAAARAALDARAASRTTGGSQLSIAGHSNTNATLRNRTHPLQQVAIRTDVGRRELGSN